MFVFSDLLDAGRVIIVSSILLKSVQKLNLNLLRKIDESAPFDRLVIFKNNYLLSLSSSLFEMCSLDIAVPTQV